MQRTFSLFFRCYALICCMAVDISYGLKKEVSMKNVLFVASESVPFIKTGSKKLLNGIHFPTAPRYFNRMADCPFYPGSTRIKTLCYRRIKDFCNGNYGCRGRLFSPDAI